MTKQFTVIISEAPQKLVSIEALDSILMAAAFDFKCQVIFINQGIFHLLKQQNEINTQKNVLKILKSFDMLDIKNIFVLEQACKHYGLQENNIGITVSRIDYAELKYILQKSDYVLRF